MIPAKVRPLFLFLGLLPGLPVVAAPQGQTARGAPSSPVHLAVRHASIRPGARQTVVIQGLPAISYQIQVTMPDGEKLAGPAQPHRSSGTIRWSFIQPPGTLTHDSRRATVHLSAGGHTYKTQYVIAFQPMDLVVPHMPVAENSDVTLWVHAGARARVTLQLSEPSSTTIDRSLTTGPDGWASTGLRAANDSPPFQTITVTVVAGAVTPSGPASARADFQVLPFQFRVSLQGLQILHQVAGSWVPTSSVHPGEAIRIQGTSYITEPAGNMPLCVPGYVTVVQGFTPIQMAPLHCADSTMAQIEADLQLSTTLAAGAAGVDVDLTYENGSSHVAVPISITSG